FDTLTMTSIVSHARDQVSFPRSRSGIVGHARDRVPSATLAIGYRLPRSRRRGALDTLTACRLLRSENIYCGVPTPPSSS
ncbi:MAG: hypothetical protein ACXWNJ_07575, partial [Vulcanimicrobiaceae bacterium]